MTHRRAKLHSLAAAAVAAVIASCTYEWDAFEPNESGGGAGSSECAPDEVVPCYTGPDGTEGVGICVAGEQLCQPDGTLGPCEGEVTPVSEDCATPGDDDCSGDAVCSCEPGTSQPCYDGPEGTEGVAACHGGQQVCLPTGDAYSVCYPQILPIFEDCASTVDDDCNGATNENCALWSVRHGGGSNDYLRDLATDSSGNVLIVGSFNSSNLDFGGGALNHAGSLDLFVAKLGSDGSHAWSVAWGDGSDDEALAVVADFADNIYVAGSFAGSLDVGNPPVLNSAGGRDVFVMKLNAAGQPLWQVGFGGGGDDKVRDLAVDAAGDVVIAGSFRGTVDFGGGQPRTAVDSEDAFVVKLGASGAYQWDLAFGGNYDDAAEGVAVDAAGVTYIAGWFNTKIQIGSGPNIDGGGYYDAFVAKVDASGNHVWSQNFGPGDMQYAYAIAIDGDSNVVVGGGFHNSIDTGGGDLFSYGRRDAFVVKLDTDGNHLWNAGYGDAFDQQIDAITVDPSGNLYIAARMEGTVDLGGGPMICAATFSDDAVLVKLDASGNYLHGSRFGDTSTQRAPAVALDSSGDVWLAVDCNGNINFGNGQLVNLGYTDICIARFAP